MGVVTKSSKRRVIPRWRELKVAEATGELQIVTKGNPSLPFQSKAFIEEQIRSWSDNRDIPHAGDLLSSAYVLGLENDFTDIAKFVLNAQIEESSPIIKIANKVLKRTSTTLENEFIKDVDEVASALDTERFRGEIRKYKAYLQREPKNPIAWIELGRLYSMVGQNEKAERCVNHALYFDKNNRFIVRSASRFFHHYYPYTDRALQVIKRSEYAKTDPWLLSAEIAYSTILGRYSKFAKIGIDFVKNFNKDYINITELTSSIGTLELGNGKIKGARQYFATSLLEPNDNSAAQASWVAGEIHDMPVDIDRYDLPMAFEAYAQLAFNNKLYREAYEYALKWLADEPFSSRPIKFASHVCCVFLDNINQGISLLRAGLKVNPNDLHLNNNLVYYLAKDGHIREAVSIYETKVKRHIKGDMEVHAYTVVATAGLLAFRSGLPNDGRIWYSQAINLIKLKDNSDYLLALANLNLIEEELRYTEKPEKILGLARQMDFFAKKVDQDDVQIFYNKLVGKVAKLLTKNK